MQFLGKDYSEKIAAIYDGLNPRPSVLGRSAGDTDPRFAGHHRYHPDRGDEVFIVPGVGHEYTLGHELMHAVLRRGRYPHFTFRELGMEFDLLHRTTTHLEGVVLHPVLNRRLAELGVSFPHEYAEALVHNQERGRIFWRTSITNDPQYYLPICSLLFVEITMWGVFPRAELERRMDIPDAWRLADQIISGAQGLETASPERCREGAVSTVKTIDSFLQTEHRQESDLYFTRILFPPPPLVGDPESPANKKFGVQLRTLNTNASELEISLLNDGTFCWSDGPLYPDEVQARITPVRNALQSLSSKDFADFCERFIVNIEV